MDISRTSLEGNLEISRVLEETLIAQPEDIRISWSPPLSQSLSLHPTLSFSPPTATITVGNLPCHQEDSDSMVNIPGKPNQKRDLRIKQKVIKRV